MKKNNINYIDVLVIGCGGAGLRAAIEVASEGLNIQVIGKRSKFDAHTVLAAGGINAAFGNVDFKDSWEQHFIDTFIEGYGIGDPEAIEIVSKESPAIVKEIDNWGANLQKLTNGKFDQRFFGAHTYRRTCYSGDYTGQSILNALLKKSEEMNIAINDSEYVTDLLIHESKCYGAVSFNKNNLRKTIHLSKSVILCTGGHTRIWQKSSSRAQENNGDGFYLAAKAGCNLIDMEMVQFHPTGMLKPDEIAGTLVTEAVRGEGGLLFNKKGERFMVNYDKDRMELSTRDRVALANYNEIINDRGTPNGGVFLDISHKDKDFILQKLPKIYKQFLEYQNLDISKTPMEVAPTAHYSMGGIYVDPNDLSTCVNGLFAAGEVAGGLHGANRLGGNSLAEILIFGKKAGISSVSYSRKLKKRIRSQKIVDLAHENINKFIGDGNESSKNLQNELRLIMWKYCGVIKSRNLLNKGLVEINFLKNKLKDINVKIQENNCQDLFQIFDLQSSIISAEATIISALERNESRGAHQRSDFTNIDSSYEFNCCVGIEELNQNIYICRSPLKKLKNELKVLVENEIRDEDFRGKLLE